MVHLPSFVSHAAIGCLLLLGSIAAPHAAVPVEHPVPVPTTTRPPTRYGVDVWDASTGLLSSRIRSIAQTPDGYIWLGTDNGLLRFNGVTFTSFGVHTGSLRDNEVGALAPDGDGGLWIGTFGGGLTHMSRGRFVTYTVADGLPDDDVRLVDRAPDGSIWFTTRRGIGRHAEGAFEQFGTPDGLPSGNVIALCARSAEGVFVATLDAVFRLSHRRFERIAALAPTRDHGVVNALTRANDGALLVLLTRAVTRFSGGLASVTPLEGSPPTNGRLLYQDPAGTLWIGAREGLYYVEGTRMEPLPPSTAASGLRVIYSLLSDREGSLWVGTETSGLARLRPTQLSWIGQERGLPDVRSRAIIQDRSGTLWLGTSQGLVSLGDERTTAVPAPPTPSVVDVSALEEGRDGALWVGVLYSLFQVRNGRFVAHAAWKDRGSIRRLYQDPNGPLWVGTDGNGLFRVDGARVDLHPETAGGARARIRDVTRDRHGNLWIATFGGGVLRQGDGGTVAYTTNDGLGSDYALDIYEDTDGMLWVSTRAGLACFRNGRFVTFTAANGLACTFVHAVQQDRTGDFWFGCVEGIFNVSRADMQALARGQAQQVISRRFGVADGMKTLSCAAGTFPTIARAADGRLFFCTLKGVAVIDPADRIDNPHVPPVNIEAVRINQRPVSTAGEPTIPPGRGDVEIQYNATTFLDQDEVLYRYRLEGDDPAWVDAGSRRTAFYTGLAPGRYRFQVVARNSSGVWNSTGAAFAFTLEPRFYQTTWFLLWCAASLGLGAAGLHRQRVHRLVAAERELKRRVDEALGKVKVLSGLLPVCAHCKQIRDDHGYWNSIEKYIAEHSESRFSHGICPNCVRVLYPDLADSVLTEERKDAEPPPAVP